MTRLEAKRIIDLYPIIEAFANGAEIEFYDSEYDSWQVLEEPSFDSDMADYRIKKQEYRPFKNIQECWNEMLKHQPFGWIKRKDEDYWFTLVNTGDYRDFKSMLDRYTFADGEPFGIKED